MKSHYDMIRPLMEKGGIDMKRLAVIAGVGPSAVTKWKNGGAIRIKQLQKIADHFRVDIHDLMPRNSLSVNESELEEWKQRALAAEQKLARVNRALGHALKGFEELQEAVR